MGLTLESCMQRLFAKCICRFKFVGYLDYRTCNIKLDAVVLRLILINYIWRTNHPLAFQGSRAQREGYFLEHFWNEGTKERIRKKIKCYSTHLTRDRKETRTRTLLHLSIDRIVIFSQKYRTMILAHKTFSRWYYFCSRAKRIKDLCALTKKGP